MEKVYGLRKLLIIIDNCLFYAVLRFFVWGWNEELQDHALPGSAQHTRDIAGNVGGPLTPAGRFCNTDSF